MYVRKSIAVLFVFSCLQASGDVLRVPGDFPTIQEAIDAATAGDEVVIADGVYSGEGNRDIDFRGKEIIVRSENGPENCIIDLSGEERWRGFHFHSAESPASVLRGISIVDEFQDPRPLFGGGILIDDGSPTIVDCTFFRNTASRWGGGIALFSGSPEIRGCSFVECSATAGDGNGGGGLYSEGTPAVLDCWFEENVGRQYGGGVFSEGAMIQIERCTFYQNGAPFEGGAGVATRNATITNCTFQLRYNTDRGNGIRHRGGDLVVRNCTFRGGAAVWGTGLYSEGHNVTVQNCQFADGCCAEGAGMFLDLTGVGLIDNCRFWRNEGFSRAGGLFVWAGEVTVTNSIFAQNYLRVGEGYGGIYVHDEGQVRIANSILWDNQTMEVNRADISHSIIRGGWPGEGNIDADPLFVDAENGDLRLMPGSPAIDSGDNLAVPADVFDLDGDGNTEEPIPFDLDGYARFADDPESEDTGRCGDPCERPIVDMGAYEYGSGAGVCCMADRECTRDPRWRCDGDVDGDGQVNPVDAGIVQSAFCSGGICTDELLCQYDMDCDGQINPVDAGIVQSLFGTCAVPRVPCDGAACVEVTAEQCHARGGTYMGRSLSCSEDACGTGAGACCLDLDCAGTSRRTDCDAAGGRWYIFEDCAAGFDCPEVPSCGWDNALTPNGDDGYAMSPPRTPDQRVVDDVIADWPGCLVQDFHASVIEDDAWIAGDVITIYVYEDTEARPRGAGLYASVDTGFTKMATGDMYFERAGFDYQVEDLAIDLPPGRWWIGFRNPDASGSGSNYWMTSDGGIDGVNSSPGYYSPDGGDTWRRLSAGPHQAFQLVP